MVHPEIFFGVVLSLGIGAQWLAWRLRLPAILVLLAAGFLVGLISGDHPDLPGQTISDEVITPRLLFPLVSMAVGVIMFEGGLTLRLRELADGGTVVLRLVTTGVLVTWTLITVIAYLTLKMDVRVAGLVGAILVVTGPTVIAPLLRQIRPNRRIGSIVKWEGIVIDPIGAMLAVLVFESLFVGTAIDVVWLLLRMIAVAAVLGLSAAWIFALLMRRFWIPDYLHNPVMLAAALAIFVLSNQLVSESGLLTVTIMGVALANQQRVSVRHVLEFKENLRVLLISCLFIVLAARIRLNDLVQLGWGGVLFVVLLIVLVRPLAVFCATLGTELTRRERVFLACLAPRGIVAAAVASVFALEVMRHRSGILLAGTDKIVPLTFLVIVSTVAVYGLAAAPLARRLKLASADPHGILFVGASEWIRQLATEVQQGGAAVLLVDTNYRNIAAARMAGLPGRCTSILNDATEELDLAGIGRLLALTSNDDLNTLAAVKFASVFGRANVYQLPQHETKTEAKSTGAEHFSGRTLFDPQATSADLESRWSAGATIKKTKISNEFSFDDFLARYGPSAIILFVWTETHQLLISTADEPLLPKPGQTVIALVGATEPIDMNS